MHTVIAVAKQEEYGHMVCLMEGKGVTISIQEGNVYEMCIANVCQIYLLITNILPASAQICIANVW